jgi:hypothetical protein
VRFQGRGEEVRRFAHTTSTTTAQQFLAGLLDDIVGPTVAEVPAETARKLWNAFPTDSQQMTISADDHDRRYPAVAYSHAPTELPVQKPSFPTRRSSATESFESSPSR